MYLKQASYTESFPAVEGRNEMLFISPTSEMAMFQSSMETMSYNNDDGETNKELPFDSTGNICNTVQTQAFGCYHYSVSHKEMYSNTYHQYDQVGCTSSFLHSKYLKPVQVLLEEVVNIRRALKQSGQCKSQTVHGSDSKDSKEIDGRTSNPSKLATNSSGLSPSERQDLQNKKTKLLSMLDEVDKRYSQYYHQMQSLISSFEMVAGFRAAKPYTSLAFQTISRHFRCLRDALKAQIRVTRRKLGESETSIEDQLERIPRLRYVDHQIRQQRDLHQQLGDTMRPVWRPPQRGLPESSVSILRAWLFEHFLHPYPKDSEKLMLAKQTGLTRNQVANWFINARVRLWKPMIEEMYREEFGDAEAADTKSSQENSITKEQRENSTGSESKAEEFQETAVSSALDTNLASNSFTGSNIMDYHHVGLGVHQDRFSNPHQFHDFVV